jgi:hypothetical protein
LNRLRRWLTSRWIWLTLLVAFVVWHTAFDVTVNRGMKVYLARHASHEAGQGPPVTIHGVMDEAVARGARYGVAGAAVVLAASAGLWWTIARRRASRRTCRDVPR